MKKIRKNRNKFHAQVAVAALSLAVGISGASMIAFAEEDTAEQLEVQLDYIGDKYNLDEHIFDVLTIDRLDLLLDEEEEPGKSVVVFADIQSPVSQAAIPEINRQAKELGIEKVYYFDLLLAGEYGVDIWDNPEETWPNVSTKDTDEHPGSVVTQAFVDIKNYLATETALKDVPSEFEAAADTYLFVLDDQSVDGRTSKVISSSVLIEDEKDLKEDEISEVLNTVIEDGQSVATTYSNFDYFNSNVWKDETNKSFYEDYSEYEDNFKLRSITYYELRHLLELEGEHNILIAGSWCGDGHLALPFVIENSSRYDSDTVYVFDFRLSNSVQGSRQTAVNGNEGYTSEERNYITTVGHLGEEVIEKLGGADYINGAANSTYQYVIDGNVTVEDGVAQVEYATSSGTAFRSPYLFKYNKDAEEPVVAAWLHEVQEWEIPYSEEDPIEAGTLIDNELVSGTLSTQQKALSRYDLAVFLGAKELQYMPPVIKISETDSELDSGCGDDNDPIDNLGQEKLIPNQGSTLYDVSHYDLDITLKEAASGDAADTIFEGTAVIHAKAIEAVENQIIFDFRRQEIEEISVKNVTTGEALPEVSYEQINDDNLDLQKLIVKFDGTIEPEQEVEVSVTYKTYTIDYSVAELGSPQGFSVHTDEQGYTAIGEPFGATYWYPNNNTPSDGATYTITLRAPIGYTTVSNGIRTEKVDAGEDGKARTTWEVTQPTAGYQIFATFSKNIVELESFSKKEYTFETADGRKIPIYSFVNKDIYKENRYAVDRFYGLLPYYIKTLESLYGAYPGEALGFVFENVGDGNGGSASWGAVETKDRPFYTSNRITGENTFVHEFAHQCYGDAVRIKDWNNLWLNEGFATFGSDLYYEKIGTVTEGGAFTTYQKYYDLWKNTDEDSALWATAPADVKRESDLFGGAKVAYNRGALALEVLRDGLGDDVFFEILQQWLTQNQGQAKTTEEFLELAESISGTDLSEYAQVWLYGTTKPAAFNLNGVE